MRRSTAVIKPTEAAVARMGTSNFFLPFPSPASVSQDESKQRFWFPSSLLFFVKLMLLKHYTIENIVWENKRHTSRLTHSFACYEGFEELSR